MASDIIFLSSNKSLDLVNGSLSSKIGQRASYLNRLASLSLPIPPAAVFPSNKVKDMIADQNIQNNLEKTIKFIEEESYYKLGSSEFPLFGKILTSPDLDYYKVPAFHNVGLNTSSANIYAQKAGADFVNGELSNLWFSILELLNEDNQEWLALKEKTKNLMPSEKIKHYLDFDKRLEDPFFQYKTILQGAYKNFYKDPYNEGLDFSLIVQLMVYSNWDKESIFGKFTTSDIHTGMPGAVGSFICNAFSFDYSKDQRLELKHLSADIKQEIDVSAASIEKNYKDIHECDFLVHANKFWLINIKPAVSSTSSKLRFMLNLREKDLITDKDLLMSFQPRQLQELMHSKLTVVEENIPFYRGGISGSPGSAIGRVYFSTEEFLLQLSRAKAEKKDSRQILLMESTYANDVQAIEFGEGVISSLGGFSSHAPVVARSLGKPAVVIPGIKFIEDNKVILPNGLEIKEGQYISFDANYEQEPRVFLQALKQEKPDVEENGLIDFVKYLTKNVNGFAVRCNADLPKDIAIGKKLGASGVGLCRSEHMFFEEERIMRLRQMFLVDDQNQRAEILQSIKNFQKQDYIDILKVLDGDPLLVRLLDAPLHEFLPKNDQEFEKTYQYFVDHKWYSKSKQDLYLRFRVLVQETNPMLGHRGCRLAVTYPEIYAAQTAAILEAGLEVIKQHKVNIEIMIPMVSVDRELDFIINGKDIEGNYIPGLLDVEKSLLQKNNINKLPFRYYFGSMIELPGAALSADKLCQYASFFSFGTNDLTQTTLGMSRDDINSFFADYSKYDLFEFNPFKTLSDEVKSLITIATKLGRSIRPDMKIGLCGEQAADEKTVEYSLANKLDYVSCSPYLVPVALLTSAQFFVKEQ